MMQFPLKFAVIFQDQNISREVTIIQSFPLILDLIFQRQRECPVSNRIPFNSLSLSLYSSALTINTPYLIGIGLNPFPSNI